MTWYRILFARSEASVKIAQLAQDFLDTLQAAENRDGIALYRHDPRGVNDPVVYYVSLNTSKPSRRLTDVYRAIRCPPPEPEDVEHFGGDSSVLARESML